MKSPGARTCFAILATFAAATVSWGQAPVDQGLSVYQRVEGVEGKLTLIGSVTMSQLAAIWGDSFKKLYPDAVIDVQIQGSANAVTAVIDGTANLGLLSRTINQAEVDAFKAKYGYLPVVLTPSMEQIAIYVHKDNPIKSLTVQQLDAIYSQSLKLGASKQAKTWGDLGLAGKWATQPIVCQARDEETGSQVYFKAAILRGGEFRSDIVVNETNLDMLKVVAGDPRSIGFAGWIYATDDVRMVPIALHEKAEPKAVHESTYPLVRPLQVVVNRAPNSQLSTLESEFIKYIFSQSGQQDVIIGGFVPVPAVPARIALDAVGLSTLN